MAAAAAALQVLEIATGAAPSTEDKPKKVVRTWDIETTGHDILYGNDLMFAIGTSVVEFNDGPEFPPVLAQKRWIVKLNPCAMTPDEWRQRWTISGWDLQCFDDFWSKFIPVLNEMMSATDEGVCESEGRMAAGVAAFIDECAAKYGDDNIIDVYDTIGFDVTNIENLLTNYRHRSVFLASNNRPRRPSFLKDIQRCALGFSVVDRAMTPEQYEQLKRCDRQAKPDHVKYDHNPANDSLVNAYRWVFYAKMYDQHRHMASLIMAMPLLHVPRVEFH